MHCLPTFSTNSRPAGRHVKAHTRLDGPLVLRTKPQNQAALEHPGTNNPSTTEVTLPPAYDV